MRKPCNFVSFTLPQWHLSSHEYSEGRGNWKRYPVALDLPQGGERVLLPSQMMEPASFLHSLKFCESHDLHEMNWQVLLEREQSWDTCCHIQQCMAELGFSRVGMGHCLGVLRLRCSRGESWTCPFFKVPFGRSSELNELMHRTVRMY